MACNQALIHLANLRHNLGEIMSRTRARVCLPVKADAYGHGACDVAQAALSCGVHSFAVACVQEASQLRAAGVRAPILCLSTPTAEEISSLIEHRVHTVISERAHIALIARTLRQSADTGATCGVHVKIDTGMGRIGCAPDEACALVQMVCATPGLHLEGVCTHFSVADSVRAEDLQYTEMQRAHFMHCVQYIRKSGISIPLVHAANSAALLCHPRAHFDMVRPGLLAYGYAPESVHPAVRSVFLPVMELVTQVRAIKKIPAGAYVSYQRLWRAHTETHVGILPIGYADGVMRALSPGLQVCIGGKWYPVVGAICMDQCVVDLGTPLRVTVGDRVTLFGPQDAGGPGQGADVLASHAGTIPYELLCAIGKRVERVYIR